MVSTTDFCFINYAVIMECIYDILKGRVFMKQAYLIMSHNNVEMLTELIRALDSETVDIFVHIDKKFNEFQESELNRLTKKSTLYIIERIKVYWGSYSQIQAELNLFITAFKSKEQYKYYHLISGSDFPLKDIKEINNFFKVAYPTEFLEWNKADKNVLSRVKYYYPLQDKISNRKLSRKVSNLLILIQKIIKINRLKKVENVNFYKGANWVSITDKAVSILLREENINKTAAFFKKGFLVDELFVQTILLNSKDKDELNFDNKHMRLIDWERGKPYTFGLQDIEELLNSKKLFVRKINDINIAKRLVQTNRNES